MRRIEEKYGKIGKLKNYKFISRKGERKNNLPKRTKTMIKKEMEKDKNKKIFKDIGYIN